MRRWIRIGAPWRECVVEDKNGCLIWQGRINPKGYGIRGHKLAHRLIYEEEVGPIPEGLTLDHLCRNTLCVNPEHLEPVTIGVNLRRGNTFQGINTRKTHCPQGHPYDDQNTYRRPYTRNGRRYVGRACKTCMAAYRRRYRARKTTA